jgi:DNA polymerase-3 subunit delta'
MVIGHKKQIQLIKNSFLLKRLSHGLLFCGEKQLGKKKVAIEFVKSIFCEGNNKPCGKCRNCRDIEKNSHPDFIFLDSNGGEIQVSKIRDIIWQLSLKPYSSSFKVAVIDDAHLMNQESQSCFLKTLEEPKGNSFLILITGYPYLLLPTILSRVQKIKFFPVNKKEIKEGLIKEKISENRAEFFSLLSLGRPGRAIEISSDGHKLEEQEKAISDFKKINNADLFLKFKFAKDFIGNLENGAGLNLNGILESWLGYLRSIMIAEAKEEGNAKNLRRIKKSISAIQSINYLVSTTNVNPKLALELLLMNL